MKKRNLMTAAALVCTASILAGTVTAAHPLTKARFVWETAETAAPAAAAAAAAAPAEETAVEFESALLGNALREYFGLKEGEPLTQEMVDQVRRIDFCGSLWQEGLVKIEGYEDKTAVKCIINGGALTDAEGKDLLSFDLTLWDMFGGKQGMFGYEALPVMVRTSFVPFDSITDEWNRMKMKSFYVSKDITDPLLEPEAVEEMLTMYPILAADAFSILDPMAKARELAELLRIGFEFGLVNEETIIDSTTVVLPMSDISKLPTGTELYFDNLSVEYVNP